NRTRHAAQEPVSRYRHDGFARNARSPTGASVPPFCLAESPGRLGRGLPLAQPTVGRNAMISEWTYHVRNRAGYSIVETLTAIAVCGVLTAAALPHIDTRRQDIHTTVQQLVGDYRWARSRAVISGVHYSVEWTSASRYQVKRLKKDVSGAWV